MSSEMLVRAQIGASPDVSRETFERLEAYVGLLRQWQARINLISDATLSAIWSRHILDSVQLLRLKPQARCWLDLGSGGGLPGLVIGCFMASQVGGHVDLVESNAKKGAFLRHVSATLDLPVQVHVARIETALPGLPQPEIVTARALAPLDALLGFTNLLLKRGVVGLFPKGRDYQDELTAAAVNWHFKVAQHPSLTDERARILEISMEA